MQVEIAIIGGSGLYSIAGASVVKTLQVDTPWGEPSAPITVLSIDNIHIAFLPRHGIGHCISPTEVYILNLGEF